MDYKPLHCEVENQQGGEYQYGARLFIFWGFADYKKQGGGIAALIPMMMSIVPAVGFVIAGVFMAGLEDSLGRSGVLAVYWCLILAVGAAVAVSGLYILREKGIPLYDKIGENRTVSRQRPLNTDKNGFLR